MLLFRLVSHEQKCQTKSLHDSDTPLPCSDAKDFLVKSDVKSRAKSMALRYLNKRGAMQSKLFTHQAYYCSGSSKNVASIHTVQHARTFSSQLTMDVNAFCQSTIISLRCNSSNFGSPSFLLRGPCKQSHTTSRVFLS